jgi:DNA ligase-4
MAMEEYGAGIDEEEEDKPPTASTSALKDEDLEMVAPEGEAPENRQEVKEEEMNPELAEWFKVDDKGTAEEPPSSAGRYDEDSVTEEEPDSENEDVKEEPDDWVEVEKDDSVKAEVISKSAGKQPEVSAFSIKCYQWVDVIFS